MAVDVSIWLFQIQSGEGGRNPALRTLYYRLLKLLGLGISPLFVFDGPYKPKLKRNIKSSLNTACLDNFLTKQLLAKFKFPYHDAPGEAEAECALLQQEGIVDAVLSEDVDTLMFGCTLSLRNWSTEGARGGKTPTHVNVYSAEVNKRDAGLDSCGMILVALMSGGDYNTEGLRGCGPKIACEAARAGFGYEMCQLANNDHAGWQRWRTRLRHELQTNENKYFKQKNKSVHLPEDFPNQTILNYYTHPVVSSSDKIGKLKESIKWNDDIETSQLRSFVAEAFNWTYLVGAKHFIRTFAPALLAHMLIQRRTRPRSDETDDLDLKASAEAQLITSIHGRRTHWNTDGSSELRLSYTPANIVGLNLSLEESFDQPNSPIITHEDFGRDSDSEGGSTQESPLKKKGPSPYDPSQSEKVWVLETFVKLGTPLLVENWEADLQNTKKFAARKAREREALSRPLKNTQEGAMDRFVKITKAIPEQGNDGAAKPTKDSATVRYVTDLTSADSAVLLEVVNENQRGKNTTRPRKTTAASKVQYPTLTKATTSDDNNTSNPWTLSQRPLDTYGFRSPTRYSALGIYATGDVESLEPRFRGAGNPILVTPTKQRRDPLVARPGPLPRAKHNREVHTISDSSSDERTQRKDNITYRTPRHIKRPSPKKKKTPVKTGSKDQSSMLPTEPSALPQGPTRIDLETDTEKEIERHLTTPRVNRRLDFPASSKSQQSFPCTFPIVDESSCPKESLKSTIGILPVNRASRGVRSLNPGSATKGKGAVVSLRESLEGAWKNIEPSQADSVKTVLTNVQVLDLTSNETYNIL